MGVNIGGLVIDRNYCEDIKGLEGIFKKRLVFEEKVLFREASDREREADVCDIYFSEAGTLVIMSLESGSVPYKVSQQQTVSFTIEESSMTYSLSYIRNGFIQRQIVEVEGEVVESKGEPLECEDHLQEKKELIYHLIDQVVDIELWDIEPDEQFMRFRLEELETVDQEERSLVTFDFEDLEDRKEHICDEKQVVNVKQEITKVKKPQKSILKKVIKGLGLESTDFNIIKRKGNH